MKNYKQYDIIYMIIFNNFTLLIEILNNLLRAIFKLLNSNVIYQINKKLK